MGLLRLLLSITVAISHSVPIGGFTLVGPVTAVHGFFVLSGFYMSLILNEKYIKRNNSYILFITNRLLRLYPAYLAVILCILMFSLFQFYYSRVAYAVGDNFGSLNMFKYFPSHMSLGTMLYLIFTNLFIIGQDTLLFLGLNLNTGNLYFTPTWQLTYPQLHSFLLIPVTWAVSLEIIFYLIAPFILKKGFKFVSLLIILSLALRLFLFQIGYNMDPWTYRFFPTEMAFFLFGYISYRIYKVVRSTNLRPKLSVFIFLSFLILTVTYNKTPFSANTSIYLCLLVIVIPFIFHLTRKWSFDRYIGELAYPIFISHVFLLSIIKFFNIPIIGDIGITLLLMSLVFSIFIYIFIIRKIDKYRQSRLTV